MPEDEFEFEDQVRLRKLDQLTMRLQECVLHELFKV